VAVSDPAVMELREWSRLAEELQQERVRLANRVRQQLWRYYPQLLELADDVAAEWVLALWSMAPTPAKAARLREATIAKLLRQHRIRRIDAETALGILRQPAIPLCQSSCRVFRIAERGGAGIRTWRDTDKHSGIASSRGCCRRRARPSTWSRVRWGSVLAHLSAGGRRHWPHPAS
jgi:hypothetical protein